jgi:hypothetical protein
MTTPAAHRKLMVVAAGVAMFFPAFTGAQLRPLEQVDWRLVNGEASFSASIGVSRLFDQRASLAGTSGDLWEAGMFAIGWRTGRVVLEAAGTAQRFFREEERFAEPFPDVEPTDDGHRHDSGDYRISTSLRLTPESWPMTGAVRFGTRLPTTDNTTGLDRDAVDFFATVGASTTVSFLAFSGEAGLGINTTREPRFEQEDVLLYSIKAELRGFVIVPSAEVIGQRHGTTHAEIRGVEDLGELRLGLRAGSRYWVRVEGVMGYETFSPESGIILTAGLTR